MNLTSQKNDQLGFLNILVLILSIYVLGALFIETFFQLPHELSVLLTDIDFGICAIFFIDFCIRFYHANNKIEFMRWGWVDLISSIPMFDFLLAGRLFRLIKLLRIVRAFRSTNLLIKHIFKNKAEGALASAAITSVLLLLFSSIAILQVENDPESNIKTAEEAIWWSYSTFTTVSYGEFYPITTEGRIIAAVLTTAGMALFGTFTAFAASWFYQEAKEEEEEAENQTE